MASIDELIALIETDIGKSDSANASIGASRAEAEELAGLFTAMNVDGQAARTEQVRQALAEALAQGPAIRAKLEKAKTRAEALKTRGSSGGRTVSAAPAPTPLTAAPQSIREPVAKTGDAVKPVEGVGSSEDKSRLNRFIRSAGDVKDASNNVVETSIKLHDYFRNPPPTHTGTQDPGPAIQKVEPSYGVADVSLAVALGAITVSRGIQLAIDRRKKRADD